MIKKKVSKNVVLSVDELNYLVNALKNEVLGLRGQVVKSGNKYNFVTDKKLLSFIKNDEVRMEGEGGEGGEAGAEANQEEVPNDKPIPSENESLGVRSEVKSVSSSLGNINIRKRQSLLHIDEETIIMKYCELKARLENLEEATRKRFIENASKDAEADQIIDEVKEEASKKITEEHEKRISVMEAVNTKIDKITEDFSNEKMELEKKISLLQLENEEKDKLIKEKDEKIKLLIENNPNNTELIKEIINVQTTTQENSEVNNEKIKELEDELNRLKIDLQFKAKESDENEQKWKDVKADYQVLQYTVERLNLVN